MSKVIEPSAAEAIKAAIASPPKPKGIFAFLSRLWLSEEKAPAKVVFVMTDKAKRKASIRKATKPKRRLRNAPKRKR